MIAGHFGLAAAVKARAQSTPLWGLLFASQWLDVVFIPLFAAGLEGIESVPGAAPGAYGGAIIHADYTHSLLGAIALSAILGILFAFRYGKRGGTVIFAVAASHWVLDLLFHHHDMPLLLGGGGPKFGFGIWAHPWLAAGIELALVVLGGAMYFRAANALASSDAKVTRLANGCALGLFAGCMLTLGLNLVGM